MPQTLAKAKNPAFEKTRRRGPDGRFLPDDEPRSERVALSGESRKEAVLGRHRKALKEAVARHNGESVALVGSVARGDDTAASDYDFLVRFKPGTGLFTVVRLQRALREILDGEVDVMINGEQFRKGRCAESALRDAVHL